MGLSVRVLFAFPVLDDAGGGVAVHSSGVSMIFSARSLNASVTPTEVFAEASMKSEFIRRAKASPSDVGTCRENS